MMVESKLGSKPHGVNSNIPITLSKSVILKRMFILFIFICVLFIGSRNVFFSIYLFALFINKKLKKIKLDDEFEKKKVDLMLSNMV